jgi:hypothetical protein
MTEHTPLRTPECMLGHFPKIFEKGLANDRGDSYYETDLLFSPDAQKTAEYARLQQAAASAVQEEWKGSPPANLRNPFRAAGEKRREKDNSQYYPDAQFAGWKLLRVKTKNPPGVVSTKAGADGKPLKITDETEIYGGCFVRCTVNPFAYSVKGNAGVSFWLNNVQKLRDGDALGSGGARAEDDFEPVGDVGGTDPSALFAD